MLRFKYNSGWRDEHEDVLVFCLLVFTFWSGINVWPTTVTTVWLTEDHYLVEGPLIRRAEGQVHLQCAALLYQGDVIRIK